MQHHEVTRRRPAVVRRLACAALAVCLLCGLIPGCGAAVATVPVEQLAQLLASSTGEDGGAMNAAQPNDGATTGQSLPLCGAVTLESSQTLELPVAVPVTGYYWLTATLVGGSGSLGAYAFSLAVDGTVPFTESRQLYFPKQFIRTGAFDGSRQPTLAEAENYDATAMSDRSNTAREIQWFLTAGTHTLTLTATGETLCLTALRLTGAEPVKVQPGAPQSTSAAPIVIQGEDPAVRSSRSLLEQIDRTSAATVPACEDGMTYNTFGGSSWQSIGDSATWRFSVKTAGWYSLRLRCRQDLTAGASAYRYVRIDGREPAVGAELAVPYASGWQRATLQDEQGNTAWYYLEAGEHTVTLTCSMGELSTAVALVQKSVEACNRLYRRIIMITGTSPDAYRDYHLTEKVPDVFAAITEQRWMLSTVADYLTGIGSGADAAVFRKLIRQLEEFEQDADSIQTQISTLNANISAIGTWLLEREQQPLELDWLEWQPYGAETDSLPIRSGMLSQIAFDVRRILRSYTEDYDNMSAGDTLRTVNVWAVTGRDQAQILRDLSTERFTEETGIGVDLKLVAANAVMAATVAGLGPDVTLFNAPSTVNSYALRHAVSDLSGMEGFDRLVEDFYPSALVPYRFAGGVYALPETQSFPVLFYRQDILGELGIRVPETWQQLYDCITTLQKNNMTFGCCSYDVLLYQNGGSYYNENGSSSMLASEASVRAFTQWTKLYTMFSLPLSYNFINRFRTGEMPLAIADYSSFNSLVVFAPEIRDQWGMTLVPGTVQEDGSVNHAVSSSGTAAMLFSSAKDSDAAWQFLRWWVSGDTQSEYARTLEIKLGTSARVMVASKSAFARQAWTAQQKEILNEQWSYAVGTPETAGGYLVTRHINNAFRKIVYQDADVRETLTEYTRAIDKELALKRQEYGLE